MSGARSATTSISRMIAAPMAPRVRRTQKSRTASAQPDRGGIVSTSSARSMGGFSASVAWSWSRARTGASAVPDARVEPRVGDVHQEVHDDEASGHQHDERLQERVVAVGDRLHEEQADAVEVEHLLGDDEA